MAEIKSNDLYLDSDGTLGISADVDISKVKRILLTQEGTHYGSMYYLDDSDHIAEVSKKVDADLISRRGATEALYKKAFRLTVAEEYYTAGGAEMMQIEWKRNETGGHERRAGCCIEEKDHDYRWLPTRMYRASTT